ncbi:MAG: methyltransferase domain-containing protein [Acidimicrobiaceae bacterium]|nr:methyltransferase domain-containing protein [Acidimicrobiaceae bacterium]
MEPWHAMTGGREVGGIGMRNKPATGAILEARKRDPARLLDILACPQCGGHPLDLRNGAMTCPDCRRSYEVLQGVPVLREGTANLMPEDHVSNPIERRDVIARLATLDGYSLNLGAGSTDYIIPSSVELEYNVFRNTDVAADAHHLPFRDSVFEAVVSFNTFEHLYDPPVAAREIYRVLKPGGRLLLQTAFIQPLHEEPHHYYNVTEYGLRHWFSDFQIERCTAPDNLNATLALGWLSTEILYRVELALGSDVSKALGATTLDQWRGLWGNREGRAGLIWEVMKRLPDDVQKRFSQGLELDAVKPL